jgi:hypothetical protein
MYCPGCGAQIEHTVKFCKGCGLRLSEHARLLESQREPEADGNRPMRRERQLTTGVVLMLVTAFNLLIFLTVFGAITLSLGNRPGFLWMLLSFLAASLITGGLGVFNLARSGFFREMQERQLRYDLARLEEKQRALAAKTENAVVEINSAPRIGEAVSVTEVTTRELKAAPEMTQENK